MQSIKFLICIVALLWPALLNGQYIVFYDTSAYVRGAARAFDLLLGVESEWSALYDPAPESDVSRESTPTARASVDGYVTAGRSIYYGAMIYAGGLLGSMWLGLVVQALAVILAIRIVFHAFGQERSAAWSIAFIGLATPASFFASYLMPDIFAGIAVLAVASLTLLWDRLRPWARLAMAGLLLASLVFHTSHLALAMMLALPACVASALWTRTFRAGGACLVAAAIVVSLGAEGAFHRTVEAVYGATPTRPPFLMARVVADGPGTELLQATCPESGWVLCDYVDELPMGVDRFLWSKDHGIYGRADIQTRKALSAEQPAFVLSSLLFDPVGQLRATASNIIEQIQRFGIEEFSYSESLDRMMALNMPPAVLQQFRGTSLYQGAFPLRKIDLVYHAVTALAVVYLLFWLLAQLRGANAETASSAGGTMKGSEARADGRLLLTFVAIVLLGVLLNAAITGALSTPHDRYQARVIWLVPMLALLIHAWRRPGRYWSFGRGN